MKNKKFFIGLMVIALIFGLSGSVWAAVAVDDTVGLQVDTIHLIAITASDEDLLISDIGSTAGLIPADSTGEKFAYLKYTTLVGGDSGVISYKITALLDKAPPLGTELQVKTTIGAAGSGSQGTGIEAFTTIPIDFTTALDVVTTIPSCYTGTGGTDGAKVAYKLVVSDFSALVPVATSDMTITYTIQDATS